MLKEKMPYFLTNKEWYYYDMNTGKYKLTDKAPQKAIDSYNEYYNYSYYDGAPIIPEEIKKMSIEELDAELKKYDKIREEKHKIEELLEKLLKEYFKLFPNSYLFPEWEDMTNKEKIECLSEAIKDKKHISETKIFEKYEEKVIKDAD